MTVDDHLAITFSTRDYMAFGPYSIGIGLITLLVSLTMSYGYWRSGEMVTFWAINLSALLGAVLIGWIVSRPIGRWLRGRVRRSLERAERLGDEVDITVDRHGVTTVWRGRTTQTPWDTLVAVEEDEATFYFWFTRQLAYVWPARLFENAQEIERFREHVTNWSDRPINEPLLARMGDIDRASADLRKLGYE